MALPPTKARSLSVSTTSTAASSQSKKKDVSFLVYDKLVGDSDGGRKLPPEQVQELLQKYHNSWQDRLYVHWTADNGAGKECVRVKGNCMCFCGHNFKSHAWYEKGMQCRCGDCRCTGFDYLPRQASWSLTCTACKHSAVEHDGRRDGPCSKAGCGCAMFHSSYKCMCGGAWSTHVTTVESASERKALGKPVDTEVVAQRIKQKVSVGQQEEVCETTTPIGDAAEVASVSTASTAKPRKPIRTKCCCLGCKSLMPCRAGKSYNKNETIVAPELNPYVLRRQRELRSKQIETMAKASTS